MEKLKPGRIKLNKGMPILNFHAAGIDIGDTEHEVAYCDSEGSLQVQNFGTFTEELHAIVKVLKLNHVTTVAIEATGVYYVPLFLLLEEAGLKPVLVNAKHTKNVTGRKKDDTDAGWIQKLHSCGLLQPSFQPNEEDRILRDFVRSRKKLISLNSDVIRRIQKSLELMNIKIHTVIRDIVGLTGMTILKAILQGERNPEVLAKMRDRRIKASEEEIVKSLTGIWKPHHLFLLQQALNEYEFRITQIKECELQISNQLLKMIAKIKEGDISEVNEAMHEKKKKARPAKNQFNESIRPLLKALIGVDCCDIPGVQEITILEFISETGTDLTKWETSKQFSAWLNLAPNTKRSGGKEISTKMMKKKNIAGIALRAAASTLHSNKSFLGEYYRKMRYKQGGRGAVIAMAHKLSRILYSMIKDKTEFKFELAIKDQEKAKASKIKQLERQIEKLKNAS